MTRNAQVSISTVDQFIAAVSQVKTASDGTTPLSEPGSIGGETSHPVKRVDDRLEKAKEGERSAENSKDVKKDQGALSIENAPQASTKAASIFSTVARFAKAAEGAVSQPGSAEDDHTSTTTKVAPTGEDPAHETNSAKAGKEDKKQGGVGGTSHPASTENDQLDGHKYASDSLEKLASDLGYVGNDLLAQIHQLYTSQGGQMKQASQQRTQAHNTVDPQLAYYAGNELAGLVSGQGLDKRAADTMVRNALVEVIKQASADADAFVQYAATFLKRASEPGEPIPPMGDPSGGMGGPPAGAGGAPGDAAMMSSIGGDGDADDAGAAPGGGDEEAMMAALGGGAGGADAAGGGGEGGESEEELAAVLEQLGVSPEELIQAMQQQEGGGGDAGGPPPSSPGGMETQASVGGGKRIHGTQKIAREEITNHIREILGRSRLVR